MEGRGAERRRKVAKVSALVILIIVLVIAVGGAAFIGFALWFDSWYPAVETRSSVEHVAASLREEWQTDLPQDGELLYFRHVYDSHGHGHEYSVIRYDAQPTAWLSELSYGSDDRLEQFTDAQRQVMESSMDESIPQEYAIDWEDAYYYRMTQSVDERFFLTLVYDDEQSLCYVMRSF